MTHEQILARLFAQWSRTGTLTYDDMMVAHEQMVLMKDHQRKIPYVPKRDRQPEPGRSSAPNQRNWSYMGLIFGAGLINMASIITSAHLYATQHNIDDTYPITGASGFATLMANVIIIFSALILSQNKKVAAGS